MPLLVQVNFSALPVCLLLCLRSTTAPNFSLALSGHPNFCLSSAEHCALYSHPSLCLGLAHSHNSRPPASSQPNSGCPSLLPYPLPQALEPRLAAAKGKPRPEPLVASKPATSVVKVATPPLPSPIGATGPAPQAQPTRASHAPPLHPVAAPFVTRQAKSLTATCSN